MEDIDNKYSFVDLAKEQRIEHQADKAKLKEQSLRVKKEKAKAMQDQAEARQKQYEE